MLDGSRKAAQEFPSQKHDAFTTDRRDVRGMTSAT